MDICPKCGLPKQACVCEEIAKSEQQIRVKIDTRRYGKKVTLVEGLEDVDIAATAKELKNQLACGGTVKNKVIELQGDHLKKTKEILIKMGFPEDSISES